jgi:predicted ATP-dependent endonuclease of OLD family
MITKIVVIEVYVKLTAFRVTNFRSVDDSGWVDIGNVTALIGTNESGKTNLLLPLWKLNPAKDGAISPTADFPRKKYNEFRSVDEKPVFIQARFELEDDLAKQVAELADTSIEDVRIAQINRKLDGKYSVGFPEAKPLRHVPKDDIAELLKSAKENITSATMVGKSEEDKKTEILKIIENSINSLPDAQQIDANSVKAIKSQLELVNTENASKRSTIIPRLGQLIDSIGGSLISITKPHPQQNDAARNLVLENLPNFVYYSNYGNLDSEIYLPHVIANLQRDGLGAREEAKARTLKVLFEFVKLQPQEILELGKDFKPTAQQPNAQPTPEEIKQIAEKKKERDILLQSAGAELTQKFRDWWKQGDYRFRFQADGDHFRIWVSDDKRPEDIELEGRSTGLQWFLSFYLIFLVESIDTHENCILLLDEPGLSLHPLAQRDLSEFFDNLSYKNQLLYTTHSPFMVDPDHLDRVKAVYVGDNGTTFVSPDLRAAEPKSAQSKSVYPVFAALGLSISDSILQGCQVIIVEGASDQVYLSAMKNILIGKGKINPKKEIIFAPAGGVKGVNAVASIMSSKDDEMPVVLLDSDGAGSHLAKQLKTGLYQGDVGKILLVNEYRTDIQDSEVEDLIPLNVISKAIDRMFRSNTEKDFSEVASENEALIPQIERFASQNGINLKLGWKVDLAKQVKAQIQRADLISEEYLILWAKVFKDFEQRLSVMAQALGASK